MKERHVDGLQGWISVSRMRYYCRRCHKGFYPLDQRLKLSGTSRMSQQKEQQLALLSVRLPYEEARKVYGELTGHATGRMTAHRTVQRLGCCERDRPCSDKKLEKSQDAPKGIEHATADGTMIHIREEGWKEAKVGASYQVNEDRRAENIRYAGTLGSREFLGEKLYRLCGMPGDERTKKMAFIGDAAEWLTIIQELHFPGATRIVDFWHASEWVWKVAASLYGQGSRKAVVWAETRVSQLRKGSWRSVLWSLTHSHGKTAEQKEILHDAVRYFRNHVRKMNYPLYERQGFHIGSGIAEGACKHVVQCRFKQAGMRWSRNGAENLLALRIAYLNQGHLTPYEYSSN